MLFALCSIPRGPLRQAFQSCCHVWFRSSRATSSSVTAVSLSEDSLRTDPERLFTSDQVQELLVRLAGLEVEKVFRRRQVKDLERPYYQLLTDEELRDFNEESRRRARQMLQFPPYMKPRQPIRDIIASDPEIAGHDASRFIFTDITFGVPDRKRLVVVRESDGTLRRANWDERDKMNRLFFHFEDKPLKMPKVFLTDNLQKALADRKHEFVLDFACHFFEPDDPEYLRICESVYKHLDDEHAYDVLYSTRHYGGFVFYLSLNKKIDDLLLHLAGKPRYTETIDLVKLFYTMHGGYMNVSGVTGPEEYELLAYYAKTDSRKRSLVEETVQGMKQKRAEDRRKAEG